MAGAEQLVVPQPGAAAPFVQVVPADTTGTIGIVGEAVEDPVNTASGNLVDSVTDLEGEAFGLDLVRSYNTFDPVSSALGEHWRFGTGGSLQGASGSIRYTSSDGTALTFAPDGAGGWITPVGIHADLLPDAATPVGGGPLPMFQLEYRNGNVERFDTNGRLIEQQSWDGRSAVSTYNASGTNATTTASTGQTLNFAYGAGGRLESVELSNGRRVNYGYDVNGRLANVTDEFGAVTSMTYTASGWLASLTDPAGIVQMSNTYDIAGRVVQQTSASGGTTTFTYYPTDGATYVFDSVTNTGVRYQHDQKGRVIVITDPYGGVAERNYDANSNLVGGTDRNGYSALATYDVNDNLTSTTQPGSGTTSYVYDSAERLTSVTDPWGATTTYGYQLDEQIPSTITNALGQATTYDIVDGLIMSVTDADGVTVTNSYDVERRLISVTNEYGQSTTYDYNSRGQRTQMTSPSGRVTVWAYDPITSRPTSATAPDGGVSSTTYDAAGRILTTTDPTNAVSTNAYDTAGRLATVTDPGGSVTTYQYDANDHLTKVIEPGGGNKVATYGPLGRVTSTADQMNRTTTFAFDSEGRQTKSTNPVGAVRQTAYDSFGRPFKTIDPQGRETVTTFDSLGRPTAVTAPGSLTTTYGYDPLGRITSVTTPRGGVETTSYTPGGRRNTVTDAMGRTTTFGYDLAGRNTSVTAPGNLTTSFVYDADDEVTSTTSPGGLVTTTTFNLAGRPITSTDPAGVTTVRTWSLRGELLTVKKGAEGTISYTYNPNGTIAGTTDALGALTTFGYDARHNQTSRTAPNGATYSWTYNAANQLLSSTDPLGRTTTYTYDAVGRPASVTDPSGRVSTTTYNLDGSVNIAALAGGTSTTYGYDTAGRIATMANSTGTLTLGYEPGGQLASQLTQAGRQTTWTYDASGRRSTMTYPDGAGYQYVYDTSGRLQKITPTEVMADTFTAGSGTIPDSGKWTTAAASSGTATVQSNSLRLLWSSTASSTASVTSKSPSAQDSEQLLRFQFTSTTSTTVGKFVVKARSSANGNVRVEFTSNSTTAVVFKQVGSTSTQLGTFTTVVGTTPRWVRLKVVGTTVSVRTWADGVSEPTTWNSTLATATGVTTAGVPKLEVIRTSGTNSVTIDNYRHIDPSTPPAPIATYAYNNDSQITSETLAGGSRNRTYTLGRLTAFSETLPGLTVNTGRTYDTTGRLDTEITGGVTTTFGYDNASQIVSSTPSTGTALAWTYDQLGQRLTATNGATTTKLQYDLAGQLCWSTTAAMPTTPTCASSPSGATTYTHDAAGRVLTETVTSTNKVTYTYDAAGQLSTAQRVNGAITTTQTSTYNQLHQLVGVANSGGSTSTSVFDWDPTKPAAPLAAITTANSTTDLIGGPAYWAAARTGGVNNAIGVDVYGSVLPSTPTTNLARASSYSAFGNPTSVATFEPKLGYRGELVLDVLVQLRARTYEPSRGVFLSADPVEGVLGSTTLNNKYHYTGNSPLQNADPLGLFSINDHANFGTGLGSAVAFLEPVLAATLVAETVVAETVVVAEGATGAATAGGTTACLATALVCIGIIGGTIYLAHETIELVHALGDMNDALAREDSAKYELRLVYDRVQEMVDNCDIPEGMYGGKYVHKRSSYSCDDALERSAPSSKALRTALENAGFVGDSSMYDAHHIVAGKAGLAEAARIRLARFDIGINSADNGVFLPRNKDLVPMTSAAYHNSLHKDTYYAAVNAELAPANTPEEARKILHRIRDRLLSGGFP